MTRTMDECHVPTCVFPARLDHPQPAGTYRVLTDEDEIPGLSFRFSPRRDHAEASLAGDLGGTQETISIDASALASALATDGDSP